MIQNRIFLKYPLVVWLDSLTILFISLFIFSFHYNPEFIAFQTRFAVFVQEMVKHGISFFPSLYQKPYPDYLSTMTILSYGLSKGLGQVSPFTVFFPTAFAASLTLVVTYLIGYLHSRIWGWTAVLMSLLTFSFVNAAYNVSIDQVVALVTALSFYIIYASSINKTASYLKIFVYLLAGIGFLFRGPIGFVIPIGVVAAYYLYERQFKNLIWTLGISCFVLIICGLLEFILAYLEGGWPLIQQVISFQVLRRLSEGQHASLPYFYWINAFGSYAISYPFAVLVILAQRKAIWKREDKDSRFLGALVVWVLVILVGLSIPCEKKIRYILPIVPALSLIAASLLILPAKNRLLQWGRRLLILFCQMLPYLGILLIILVIGFSHRLKLNEINPHFYGISLSILLILIIMGWVNRGHFRNQLQSSSYYFYTLVIAVLALLTLNWFIYQPVNYQLEKSRPFIEKFEKAYHNQPAPLVFYRIGPDREDIKFMSNLKLSLMPLFVSDRQQLSNLKKPFYLIVSDKDYSFLKSEKLKFIARGSIGHLPCLLFVSNS